MHQFIYSILDPLYTLGAFLVVISFIVFIHEYGHYFFARLFGVKVESFSIGFGWELFGFNDKAGTHWKFCILPAGGYVKMFGDSPTHPEEDGVDANSKAGGRPEEAFFAKPLYQKSIIAMGGPLANFLSAIIIIFLIYSAVGKSFVDPVITALAEGQPAALAGLHVNDRVVKIDDVEVEDFADVIRLISLNTGEEVSITVRRDDQPLTFKILPVMVSGKDISGNAVQVARLGMLSDKISKRRLTVFEAFNSALKDSVNIVATTAKVLWQLVSGKRDVKEVGGPIRIAQYSGKSLAQGFIPLLWLVASLSVNLAFINLLPIPVLDGGHIAHNAIEKFIGQSAALKFQAYSTKVGTVLLILLFVVITFNDVSTLFGTK